MKFGEDWESSLKKLFRTDTQMDKNLYQVMVISEPGSEFLTMFG